MVLGILIAVVAAPALLGSQEAIRQSQSKEKREEHRARRCNLIASCVKSSARSREINGRPVVLRNGKLWIDTTTEDGQPFGHTCASYYLPYPDSSYEGLVTTITDVAPILNWVYIDKDTYEARYGVRLDAQPNLTGPFDCSRQDRRLTFDGWEGWCAVEEAPSLWALYFDKDDDGLRSKVAPGTRVLEVELSRKETRWKKESEARQQDQTTKREVDTTEDTPTDGAITAQPTLNPPGVGVPSSEQQADEAQDKASVAAPTLKPLSLPKSIFSDPPRPIFADSELLPSVDGPGRLPIPKSIFEDAPSSPPPAYSRAAPPQAPYTPPKISQSYNRTPSPNLNEGLSVQQPRYNLSPPQNVGGSPPTSTSLEEKRTTPKLNRKSGTRAMSQAQMFDALAAGNALNDTSFRNRSRSPSRPVSNATSVSDYSNPPKTSTTEIFQLYEGGESNYFPSMPIRPSIYDSPKAKTNGDAFPAADPAVFGASPTVSLNTDQRNEVTANNDDDGILDRKPPLAEERRPAPTREKLRDPFVPVKGKTPQRTPQANLSRTPSVSQSKQTPPPSTRAARANTTTLERRRRSSPPARAPPPARSSASSSRQPSSSRGTSEPRPGTKPIPPRSRADADDPRLSSPSSTRPKPPARTSTAPAAPRSRPMTTATTMTSGTGNRAMATRLASSTSSSSSGNRTPADPPLPRAKRSSSLMRDLDALIAGGERRSTPSARDRDTGPGTERRSRGIQQQQQQQQQQPPPLFGRRSTTTRDSDAAGGRNRALGAGRSGGGDVRRRGADERR